MSYVQDNLDSPAQPGGSRMVSCPNPSMHDVRSDVFWPRVLEQVTTVIGRQLFPARERAVLQPRVDIARLRIREMDQAQAVPSPASDSR